MGRTTVVSGVTDKTIDELAPSETMVQNSHTTVQQLMRDSIRCDAPYGYGTVLLEYHSSIPRLGLITV